jgi:hypothetical protein
MPRKKPSSQSFTLTEEANAVDYLCRTSEFVQQLKRDQDAWKWVIIGIHGALYSFAVCAIKGTSRSRVTTPTKSGHRLVSFAEAIKRCQRVEFMTQNTHSKVLSLTDSQKEAIASIKARRNQIEHYAPLYWHVEKHDVVVSTVEALDVIQWLALDSGNVRPHLDQHQQKIVATCVRKAKAVLQSTQLYKDYIASQARLRS